VRTILLGIVGSTAYGLRHEGSDVDTLGVGVASSTAVWGLNGQELVKESRVTTAPDSTLHEVGKFCRLALKSNPSVLELLWLEDWLFCDPLGSRLVELRRAFLSERGVRNAYGGYARQQLNRLETRYAARHDHPTDRADKHARHILRLMDQGTELLETGSLRVRVLDPERYFALDGASLRELQGIFHEADERFQRARSVLPDEPNLARVESTLLGIRRYEYARECGDR